MIYIICYTKKIKWILLHQFARGLWKWTRQHVLCAGHEFNELSFDIMNQWLNDVLILLFNHWNIKFVFSGKPERIHRHLWRGATTMQLTSLKKYTRNGYEIFQLKTKIIIRNLFNFNSEWHRIDINNIHICIANTYT